MRGGLTFAVVVAAFILTVTGPAAAGDDWARPKPRPSPSGEAISLSRQPGDAGRLPLARVRIHLELHWPDETQVADSRFDMAAAPAPADPEGHAQVRVAVEAGQLCVGNEDFGPRIRAGGRRIEALSSLGPSGAVREGRVSGIDEIAAVKKLLTSCASWILPWLPGGEVRPGDAWDVPIPYFLWSINQLGGVPAEGFVTQVFEGIEERAGVKCARIRTVVSLTRLQPDGMTPPATRLGAGDVLARFRGDGSALIGLDGCLREDVLAVELRLDNESTKLSYTWKLRREITARPTAEGPLEKDWERLMGGLPFVVGYETGLAEAKLTGRAMMCLVAKYGDPEAEAWATVGLRDADVRARVASYLPVLVDAENLGTFPHAKLLFGMPGLVFVARTGEQIFLLAGWMRLDVFRAALEALQIRTPQPDPTDEYVALVARRTALQVAVAFGEDRPAVAALLDILRSGKSAELQREARFADFDLTAKGMRRIDAARLIEDPALAEAALRSVLEDYAGHSVGQRAAREIAALRAAEK